ncbi:hypothetical protein ABU162_22240 [Paenibacillus thiaminolyticus]|uniref:Rieske (2Fe-2S) protein n=1 Tax=Paenibacillus thiaminolyticus TaxID=49283 RepID=UPI0035A62484
MNKDKLQNLIHIRENWVAGTAILGSGGEILGENGLVTDGIRHLPMPLTAGTSHFLIAEDKAISLVKSRFDDSSYYLSLVDLPTLMKPAHVTRLISWIFLAFFAVVGSFVSYYFSRRIYQPIAEIKEGLKSHRASEPLQLGEGNDYDVIKRYSRLIISENVLDAADVPEGGHVVVQVEGREVGIFRINGEFDIKTGKSLFSDRTRVKKYELEIANGKIGVVLGK